MGEYGSAVDEVAQYGYQLAVVAGLEVGPGKVVVLGFGGVGGEHVAQHVLLAGPVARGRDFVALEVEEFVRRHIVGQLEAVAVCHKHGRENNAVEHNVVLADKVDDACFGVFPPCFPAVGV